MLKGKTIIIGITGGIAAYKSCEIVSRLTQLGAEVWVVMTQSATRLVSPLTFRTLSKNPVIYDLFDENLSRIPVPHINLTQKADLFLVVPATANIISKTAQGIADDPLSTMLLASTCPKVFAPAMNPTMWENQIIQENVKRLEKLAFEFIYPEYGRLACEQYGTGRLASIEEIISRSIKYLLPKNDFDGFKLLITAGGTREPFDPIRYLGNRSSGKMGFALAEAALSRGASVNLIAGPNQLNVPAGVNYLGIETAQEMQKAVQEYFPQSNVFIMSAAVADYSPSKYVNNKIKKNKSGLTLKLKPNPDILAGVSKQKKNNQIVVGFAAETENLKNNAQKKLSQKKLDIIVANDVANPKIGFDGDSNQVYIIKRDGHAFITEIDSKLNIAHRILDSVQELL